MDTVRAGIPVVLVDDEALIRDAVRDRVHVLEEQGANIVLLVTDPKRYDIKTFLLEEPKAVISNSGKKPVEQFLETAIDVLRETSNLIPVGHILRSTRRAFDGIWYVS